jgi:hypothetical protein
MKRVLMNFTTFSYHTFLYWIEEEEILVRISVIAASIEIK